MNLFQSVIICFTSVFSFLLLSSCGWISYISEKGNRSTSTEPIVVQALFEKAFPMNGRNWNDYVVNSDISKTHAEQTDTACNVLALDFNVSTFNSCFNGGEKLKVRLLGVTSCTDITATDQLGVFDWYCTLQNSEAVIFSRGLKDGKGLRDLIDASGFYPNSVQIFQGGQPLIQTTPSIWWENEIVALPDNSGPGDSAATLTNNGALAGRIYVLDTNNSRTTRGYILGEDKVSIVFLNGSSVNANNGAAEASNSLFKIENRKFNHLEVDIYANQVAGSAEAILYFQSYFLRLRNSKILGQHSAGSVGLVDSSSNFSRIENSKFMNFTYGMHSPFMSAGLRGSLLYQNQFLNNSFYGLYGEFSQGRTVVIENIFANNGSDGLHYRGQKLNLIASSMINNGQRGTNLYVGCDYSNLLNIAALNNHMGIENDRNMGLSFSNLYIGLNSLAGFSFNTFLDNTNMQFWGT